MSAAKRDRIQEFRQGDLKADEKKLIDDIEDYGCHIVHVRADNDMPGWSYTIGLYEKLGRPEIIVVGLKTDTAQSVLNDVASRFRSGTAIHEGDRQAELLANVDCEFRPVEQRWLRQGLTGYANWFYGEDDYPVLQCIYPDVNGVFAWEEGFDDSWRARQALLFPNAPQSRAEEDLWAAHDPKSSLYSWKFPVPAHTGVYTTKQVANGDEPVLLVTHDISDGAWQFIGTTDGSADNIT